jgi:hypothetical protein
VQAIMTLVGNGADGFNLTLSLPSAWLKQFDKHTQTSLMGYYLSPTWANSGANSERQTINEWIFDEEEIETHIEQIRAEIQEAKEKLARKLNRRIEIDLD